MKRLLELPGDQRLTARAQALVQAMGRTVESQERLLRVRRALDTPLVRARPRWAWRAALATTLVGVGAAAAAGGAAWLRAPSSPTAPAEGGTRGVVPPDPKRAPASAMVSAGARLPDAPGPDGVPSALSPHGAASASGRASAPRVAWSPPLSDVARVHEAAKALRHDGDATRALQLLERPGARIAGPLAEEALALRIEASIARADGRQAKLARAYLAQYPNGRYQGLAAKALAGNEP